MLATNPLHRFQEGDDRFGVVKFTADTADEVVRSGFERQRVMDKAHVADLATLMDDHEWRGPSTLVFVKNGDGRLRMVDGQHRVRAFISHARRRDLAAEDGAAPTEMEFFVNVVEGAPEEVYASLDARQKKRPAAVVADALKLPVPKVIVADALPAAVFALRYSSHPCIGEKMQLHNLDDDTGETKNDATKRANVPIRFQRAYVDDRLDAFKIVGGIIEKERTNLSVFKLARTAFRQARILPVLVEIVHHHPVEGTEFVEGIMAGGTEFADKLRENIAIREVYVGSSEGNPGFRAHVVAAGWNRRDASKFPERLARDRKTKLTLDGCHVEGRPFVVREPRGRAAA